MPFREKSAMSAKLEFVGRALLEGSNVSALCGEFGIGRTCGHKLLERYRRDGPAGLEERSRRPLGSPRRTPPALEAAVLAVRQAHPAWGGRKISFMLERRGEGKIAPATVTDILRRNGVALGLHGGGAKPFTRFEKAAPNELWQMDFKGHAAMAGTPGWRGGDGGRAGRLHPLTVLDDHSRYAILLEACPDQTGETVRKGLIKAFREHGMPERIICDNGPPWGDGGRGDGFTWLGVWLMEHGVSVGHARPLHPQTIGKDERFHRTLKLEAMSGPPFGGVAEAQASFDGWRAIYNRERPHDALGGAVPADRYAPSPRPFRERVRPYEHGADDVVLPVAADGKVSFGGRRLRVGNAFAGKHVAIRPTDDDRRFNAFFRHQKVATLDLGENK
jgi:transposase InsO family protein